MSLEAAELLEMFQWVKESDISLITENLAKYKQLQEELADIMIYCLSMANVLEIDVADAIQVKIAKNSSKYPAEKVRGNYKKYTELKDNE
ncbi:MazG-like family protein [Chloroflexota bacterium]